MRVILRVIKFKRQDWRHIGFLAKNCIKQTLKGDFNEAIDAIQWIRVHLTYDSKLVQEKESDVK